MLSRTQLFLILFMVGVLVIRVIISTQERIPLRDGSVMHVRTTLSQEPTIQKGRQKFSIRLQDGQYLSITTALIPSYHYGNVLDITGKLRSYMLANNKVGFAVSFPHIRLVSESAGPAAGVFNALRLRLIQLFTHVLPVASASLFLGIVFGIKTSMPSSLTSSMQHAGLTHIIAASGMNVTMVAGALTILFGRILRRQQALIASTIGVLCYLFLAGFQPSIIRASIMALLSFGAGMWGRQYSGMWMLFLTGWLMLFWQPFLIGDVGFQLSFLATWGILSIKPLFEKGAWHKSFLFADDITTTLAAQLASAPILLASFGYFNLLSFVANMLVLWTIPILMLLGGIGALIGVVVPVLALPFFYASYPFLLLIQLVADFFSRVSITLQMDTLPPTLLLGYYLLLGALVWQRKRVTKQQRND